jgi:transketolase
MRLNAASPPFDARSRALRGMILDALEGGGRGHVGSALSLVEILRVLYDEILRLRPHEPRWPDRDRLILSKGHGCLALYAVLADKGFFPASELARQCQPDALLGGHPETHIPGVGQALAARLQGRPSRVYVVIGDGEAQEGSVWEALLAAGKHRLNHLTVIVDHNHMQCYGPVAEVQDIAPLADKMTAFGMAVREIDGHDVGALRAAFQALPYANDRPSAVICHTVKGKGVDDAEHNAHWHHKSKLTTDELAALRRSLGAN